MEEVNVYVDILSSLYPIDRSVQALYKKGEGIDIANLSSRSKFFIAKK